MNPLPPLEPLVLRAARKSVLWWALLFVLWWALLFLLTVFSGDGLAPLSLMPLFWSMMPLLGVVFATASGQWGVTIVDGRGVTRRLGRSSVHVPWPEVVRIRLVPSWAGQRLVLHRTSGRPITLPGPTLGVFAGKAAQAALIDSIRARGGAHRPAVEARFAGANGIMTVLVTVMVLGVQSLLTAFVLFATAPWAQPWWPGVIEATRLPDSCTVIDREAVVRLVPQARFQGDGASASKSFRHCYWEADEPPEMSVSLQLAERFSGTDGDAVERAHEFFVDKDACPTGLRGLGDEACTGAERRPDGSNEVRVTARRYNVLVTVVYRADRPVEEITEELVPLVRTALTRIHFE